MNRTVGVILALSLMGPLSTATGHMMNYQAIFTQPPQHVPTRGMPDGPLLGNGDVGVVLAGPPARQTFYIGKNDFWTRTPDAAKIITVGRLELIMPALKGATYLQKQKLASAQVCGTFTQGHLTVRTRSWVAADEDLLVTQITCAGGPLKITVRPTAGPAGPLQVNDTGKVNVGREQYNGGRWYFDGQIANLVVTGAVLPGRVLGKPHLAEIFNGQTTWHPMAAPRMDHSVSVAAWINIAAASPQANYLVSKGQWNQAYSLGLSDGRLRWAIDGTIVQTRQPLPLHQWLYVVATFHRGRMLLYVNGKLQATNHKSSPGKNWFTRQADHLPGRPRKVAVVTRILGGHGLHMALQPGQTATIATAILSNLNLPHPLPAAKELVAALTPRKVTALSARHRAWWAKFWARSFIDIPDKLIEAHWYGALYVMGSCSRAGHTAPGLWGNWVTTDHPNWQGDFHLNYNFEAPFFLVYASNHCRLSLPFYQAIKEWMPLGLATAKKRGWKGVTYPSGIGPWGLTSYSPYLDWGQRSDAAYAALNFIWYWQYTQNKKWLQTTGYPYLRQVVKFWDHYLKFQHGRYVDVDDAIQEGHSPTDVNPILTLGLLRTLYTNIIPMSETLGVDAPKRARWHHILARLSPFPTQRRHGHTVFRYTQKGTAWWPDNTLGIQAIFPAGAIGLDSNPKLLHIARNTINAMRRWADYNGFSTWYTACARVGYNPRAILKNLHTQCVQHSLPNLLLYYGGGGIESCGGFLAINEMLLQSYNGVIRLFPDWPGNLNARFGTLRAVGAFLVSAQLKDGIVRGVQIISRKGRNCTIVNPWPGQTVRVTRNGKPAEWVTGRQFTVPTTPHEVFDLAPSMHRQAHAKTRLKQKPSV